MPTALKNTVGKVFVRAFNEITGADKTGDAANITCQTSLDGAAAAATNDVNPTEVDSTDHPGLYYFNTTAAEVNGITAHFTPVSATANIKLTPVEISIQPNFENGSMGMDWDTLTVSPASGNAVTFAGGSAGIGLNVSGVSNAIKAESTASAGATFIGGSDRSGISVLGQGSASGVISTGGATGHALELIGGSSSGRGLHVAATSGAGVYVTSASGHGAHLHAQGASSGAGLKLSGSLTGAAFQLIAGTTSGNAIDTTVTSGNHLDPYILAEINNMTNNSLGVQQVTALGTTAVFFRAYDSSGPVEANSAHIEAQISMDGAASAATVDVNPGEVDSTDHPGLYYFNITAAEKVAQQILLTPVSAISGVFCTPVICRIYNSVWGETRSNQVGANSFGESFKYIV